MASLTNEDFTWIKEWVRSSQYKAVLKASGLSKQQFHDGLQAIEDYSVGSYASTPTESLRSAINTAIGTTPTTLQNQAMWFSWAAWKAYDYQEA